MKSLKLTVSTQAVLMALLKNRKREMYGLEISTVTGVPIGSLYAILARLRDADVITDRWESPRAHTQARPVRRYYQLKPEAVRDIKRQLDETADRRAAMAKNNS